MIPLLLNLISTQMRPKWVENLAVSTGDCTFGRESEYC